MKKDLLAFNPCDRADPPQAEKKEIREFGVAKLHTIKAATEKSQFEYVYLTALHSGIRESELLGLRWCDVDLYGLTLSALANPIQEARSGQIRETQDQERPTRYRTLP